MSGHNGEASLAEWVSSIAAGGPAVPAPVIGPEADPIDESGLDVRTYALVCLAAAVTAGESGEGYDRHVAAALDQGVTRITEAAPDIFGAISRVTAGLPAAQRSGQD